MRKILAGLAVVLVLLALELHSHAQAFAPKRYVAATATVVPLHRHDHLRQRW